MYIQGLLYTLGIHVFVKNNKLVEHFETGVIQTAITDHYFTILAIPLIKHNNCKSQYNLESINFDKIVNNLKTELWIDLYNSKNENTCCDMFYYILNNAISSATEVKNISAKYKRIKQWMTAGLLCSARYKQNES